MFTNGSLAECGIVAYSPNHIKHNSWRGVTCKRCLKLRKEVKPNS